jgi:tetratricopeptide (TPR) repeat protein
MNAASCSALAFSFSLIAGDCRPCHPAIAEAFSRTGMGLSITERPSPPPARFYHRLSNRYYTFADGKLRRHQIDASGADINVIEKTVDYAIGSGNHAVTYASRTPQGRILELPVSWYSESKSYQMSPGYDRPDHHDMRREVVESCLFCHSDSAKPAAITCRRCHGDAAAHLAKPGRGNIYNPRQSIEVCLQCHLETVSAGIVGSVRKPGRAVFSYRPGEALADYETHFDRSDPPAGRFEVNHAGYRLLQSACFKGSAGKLVCVTCHDPHSAKTRDVCGTCHSSKHTRDQSSGCVTCHMPKRKAQDAIHVRLTDHWIQREPKFEDPVKENHRLFTGPVAPFYTPADPLTIAVANVSTPSEASARLFERYLTRAPDDVPTLVALGKTLLQLGRPRDAEKRLRKALAADPLHTGAHVALAVAVGKQGDLAGALKEFREAVVRNPDDSYAWLNLALTYRELTRYSEAAAAFRESIRLQPDLSAARLGLASLSGAPN